MSAKDLSNFPFNVHTLNKISSIQKINSLPISKDKMIPNLYLAYPTTPAKLSQGTINIYHTKTKNTDPIPSMNNLTMKNNPLNKNNSTYLASNSNCSMIMKTNTPLQSKNSN